MPVYLWSQTAATNATVDPSINLAAGRSPSSITPADRSTLAAIAQWRDDLAGSLVTTGTSTAYILNTNSNFTSAAFLSGQMVMFVPHVTSGPGPVTMTLDSQANLPLRSSPNTELPSGCLVAGTPYGITYKESDNALYLHGYFGNLNIPFLGGMDYWDTVTPGSQFIFPMGQAISRTTYAAAFARWGTQFGAGDGATTFNVPDKTGRVSAMMEAAQSRLTGAGFGGNSTLLGATGGLETETAPLPVHTHANSLSDPGHTHGFGGSGVGSWRLFGGGGVGGGLVTVQFNNGTDGSLEIAAADTGITINNANAGTGGAHPNVQPTIVCNYIIRII